MQTNNPKKDNLKKLARESVLFATLPGNLAKFNEEVDKLDGADAEKIIDCLIDFFQEARRETEETVDALRGSLA